MILNKHSVLKKKVYSLSRPPKASFTSFFLNYQQFQEYHHCQEETPAKKLDRKYLKYR